jgi:hypothetical protein
VATNTVQIVSFTGPSARGFVWHGQRQGVHPFLDAYLYRMVKPGPRNIGSMRKALAVDILPTSSGSSPPHRPTESGRASCTCHSSRESHTSPLTPAAYGS